MLVAGITVANAQDAKEVKAHAKRVIALEKQQLKLPEGTGVASLDDITGQVSLMLEQYLSANKIVESAVAGDMTCVAKLPEIGENFVNQVKQVAELVKSLKTVGDQIKSADPAAALKLAGTISWNTNTLTNLGKEYEYAINVIKSLTSK